MLCGRCGASLARSATACPRCGMPRAASGTTAAGIRCPGCGGERLQTVRSDVGETLFWAGAFIVVGIATLVIVLVGGDIGLLVADLSTIGLLALLAGVMLLLVARWRRRPSAFACRDCGYRVP